MASREIERQLNKKEQILNLLKEKGEEGITNIEMSKIGLRYGGYLGTLYEQGYKIHKESLGEGCYKYTLISEPEEIEKPLRAYDLLIDKVKEIGTITADTLPELLDNLNINVRYKANTYNS